ncbi:hypothetical protein [Dactylosporangium matsuzakiense]|uniref:hypothetical protein n=1 Tax=Dactylosporangium matsuzakiense TaxID=53360 RepID=UPI0021C4AA62|nr:hypothetical protein [Dactylosporangium matsuzakiense]UWZ41619.1 hypothetical protein Dmats_28675 [Dactylosporangium matsuzakiense]
MDASLEWWANRSTLLGRFSVVVEDVRTGRLRDVAHLEELRELHDLDPVFTLRFGDDSTIDAVVGRPDDDGRFELSSPQGDDTTAFTEPEDVTLTAAWLTANGFVNSWSTSSTGGNGSRLFERDDGWAVRYQCVLGTWTLELQPPHGTFVSFSRVRDRAGTSSWHRELPALIAMLTPQ